jgi:hypothetical protein
VITNGIPVGNPPAFAGERLVMAGPGTTVKGRELLATPPTFTTTFPVVAPDGTVVMISFELQYEGVDTFPLNVTVLDPCELPKLPPVMSILAPTEPVDGESVPMPGPGVTVNERLLLATVFTLSTTGPLVAPGGTLTTIVVAPLERICP